MPDIVELLKQPQFTIKLQAGGYYHEVMATVRNHRVHLSFPYNPDLLKVVKSQFQGRRWMGMNGGPKEWSVPINRRNIFRFNHLQGKYAPSPYAPFDMALKEDATSAIREFADSRGIPLLSHQIEMINQAVQARRFIWGAEMGLGKSLAAIIVLEMMRLRYGGDSVIWVGTVGSNVSVNLEFIKWKTTLRPMLMTYNGLTKYAKEATQGQHIPHYVIFDEASKLKNPSAQRTVAANWLSDQIDFHHGRQGIVGLLTGTPAPKSPSDWWSLCEVASPGFLNEGHVKDFEARLAIIEKKETIPGAGGYDKIVAWRDSDDMCDKCGCPSKHANHGNYDGGMTMERHPYVKAKNEVSELYKRMKGLVGVWLKAKCTDLPPLRYEVLKVKPSRSILNAAKLITSTQTRAIQVLTLLRELSDGFQYKDVPTDKTGTCRNCEGEGKYIDFENQSDPSRIYSFEELRDGVRYVYSEPDEDGYSDIIDRIPIEVVRVEKECPTCSGSGRVPIMRRETIMVDCPKDEVLTNLLSEHEEVGRLNVYGGFSGTLDRIVSKCHKNDWHTIRADGAGWVGMHPDGTTIPGTKEDLMRLYTGSSEDKMVFVGQPGAAGMGLTLTVSPTTFFYSNDFNAESRQQAEARGHRLGMDRVRGGRIVDVVHLETDQLILDNLKKKRDLQYLSMTGIAYELDKELSRE